MRPNATAVLTVGAIKGAMGRLVLALAVGLVVGSVAAQDGAMPTFSGKGKVTDAINGKLGAIFDIGGGITMLFPKGLPVGESRLVTLEKSRSRLPSKLVHPKFSGVGPVLDFNGAFNTAGKPIILSAPAKRDPTKKGTRLVVAMEIGTFCDGPNKAHKLKSGLCSGFELHDAEHDGVAGRLVAQLRSTGGLRLQFGTVPEEDDAEQE
jgi:hypothetical protein